MPDHPSTLAWLEDHALDDVAFGLAYDALTGKQRAVLKKAIARQHRFWGEAPLSEERARHFRQGFGAAEAESPAPWLLLLCDSAYPSPAAFLAALMPALLAGMEAPFVCFTPAPGAEALPQDSPAAPALLAALELAGVERAFAAGEAESLALLRSLAGRDPDGRLILLGGPEYALSLALAAHRLGLVSRSLTRPLLFDGEKGPAEQTFAGPVPVSPGAEGGKPLLRLDAGHEDVWFWPDLGPCWFRNRRLAFTS